MNELYISTEFGAKLEPVALKSLPNITCWPYSDWVIIKLLQLFVPSPF